MNSDIFIESVLKEFQFLIMEYGFKIKETKLERIRYESKTLYLEIIYDRYKSFEINLLIGNLKDLNISFIFEEILNYYDVHRCLGSVFFQVSDASLTKPIIEKMASYFKYISKHFFINSDSVFEEMILHREKTTEEYTESIRLNNARKKAKKYWDEKSYKKYIQILSPFKQSLRPSEVSKLDYADRQLNKLD